MAEQQQDIEKSFNILKPGGNPDVLRKCAEAWREMAHDLQAAGRDLDQQVGDLDDADWGGRAATGFREHWRHTKQQIDHGLPNFERVAKELEQAADHIEDTNQRVQHVLEELAVTAAVGLGLTVITAGFSDAVAAGAAAAEVAEAGTVVARLASLLKKVEETLEFVRGLMQSSKFMKFGVEFGTNVAGNFTGNVLGQVFTGQEVTWGQDLQDAAVAGGVGTALGAGGRAVGGKMSGALGKVFEGDGFWGKTATGAVTSAGGQMAADGVDIHFEQGGKTGASILPDLATSAIGGAAGGAAVHGGEARYEHGGGGRHRDPDTGPTFGPGRQAAANGVVYGDANANESDITADHPKSPFDEPGSALTDPDGAYGK
ncbi:WXG100 family type VII secretion target [Streptomyces inhibens]|uniref:WXG100 family type VII secretion target n=1 Tax=Streptomyces inhibens TaxID=2293571 RepID=A0A371PQ34_STRIH|nr:WXG100 family type VII secretion target [Streptomyces inhibens]REK84650.1 WXG100 family type VII secretion target [Streptomyces inhibens]